MRLKKDGVAICDVKEIIKTWAKHFEHHLNRPMPPPSKIQEESNTPLSALDPSPPPPPPPTEQKIALAVKKLEKDKAGGIDNLPPELFKAIGDSILQQAGLLRKIWEGKSTPQDWKTELIIPVFIKRDAAVCSNYRSTSLLPTAFKKLEAVFKDKLQAAYT